MLFVYPPLRTHLYSLHLQEIWNVYHQSKRWRAVTVWRMVAFPDVYVNNNHLDSFTKARGGGGDEMRWDKESFFFVGNKNHAFELSWDNGTVELESPEGCEKKKSLHRGIKAKPSSGTSTSCNTATRTDTGGLLWGDTARLSRTFSKTICLPGVTHACQDSYSQDGCRKIDATALRIHWLCGEREKGKTNTIALRIKQLCFCLVSLSFSPQRHSECLVSWVSS